MPVHGGHLFICTVGTGRTFHHRTLQPSVRGVPGDCGACMYVDRAYTSCQCAAENAYSAHDGGEQAGIKTPPTSPIPLLTHLFRVVSAAGSSLVGQGREGPVSISNIVSIIAGNTAPSSSSASTAAGAGRVGCCAGRSGEKRDRMQRNGGHKTAEGWGNFNPSEHTKGGGV